jgi:amidase
VTELAWQSAAELAAAIHDRRISARELMIATIERIDRLNPRLNAIVNPMPREAALELADTADAALAAGARIGPLHGLPIAIKDLTDATGFPTTFGFAPFAASLPLRDAPLVARLRAAGALVIGKTNTPEFGLGSHTFNALFGATANPYAPDRSAGGSSGGAAAALAAGLLAIADGSDMGGSLRNPASFCNVVGFRPTIGRIPDERPLGWFARLSTPGPMARTVADTAMLYSVLTAGRGHRQDPLAVSGGEKRPTRRPLRVALAEDLGGLPIEREVRTIVRRAGDVFEALGHRVSEACPDLSQAMEVFQVQRAAALMETGRNLDLTVPNWRAHAKPTAVWNIERGLALSGAEMVASEVARTRIYRDTVAFFDSYDVLVCPAAQVAPFPADQEWVSEIEGVRLDTYIDWMTVCCAISVTGCPAISVPAGFTHIGLPVGVQLVAAPRADLHLLRIASAFEQATLLHQQHPAM